MNNIILRRKNQQLEANNQQLLVLQLRTEKANHLVVISNNPDPFTSSGFFLPKIQQITADVHLLMNYQSHY